MRNIGPDILNECRLIVQFLPFVTSGKWLVCDRVKVILLNEFSLLLSFGAVEEIVNFPGSWYVCCRGVLQLYPIISGTRRLCRRTGSSYALRLPYQAARSGFPTHSTFNIQKILSKRSFFLNVVNIHIFLNLALFDHHFLDFVAAPRRHRLNRTGGDRTNPQPRGSSGIGRNPSATNIGSPLGQLLFPGVIGKGNTGGLVKAAAAELEIGTGGGRRRRRRRRIGSLLKALEG